MDFNKLLRFNNVDYIRLFSIDINLIHILYSEMEFNWLKLYREDPTYAMYIARYKNIKFPSIDFASLVWDSSMIPLMIHFLETDSNFSIITINSKFLSQDVIGVLFTKKNLQELNIELDGPISLNGSCFRAVYELNLYAHGFRRIMHLNLAETEDWISIKSLTFRNVDINLLGEVPNINVNLEELIFNDVKCLGKICIFCAAIYSIQDPNSRK